MQISSISTQSFKCNSCDNSQRIHQLEQKRQKIQWASEGCNSSLSSKDQYELDLRREYQALQGKAAALQWASEGYNASLPAADLIRMSEIEQELQALEPKKAPVVESIGRDSIYDVPSGNIYSVPDYTFWGEWAR